MNMTYIVLRGSIQGVACVLKRGGEKREGRKKWNGGTGCDDMTVQCQQWKSAGKKKD